MHLHKSATSFILLGSCSNQNDGISDVHVSVVGGVQIFPWWVKKDCLHVPFFQQAISNSHARLSPTVLQCT